MAETINTPPPTTPPAETDNSLAPPPKPVEVPAWKKAVPEKFHAATEAESYAKLAASYTELEKKLASKAPPAPTNDTGGVPMPPPTPPQPSAELNSILADKAFLTEASSAFAKTGKLGEAQAKRFSDAGIPTTLVDQFLTGQVARFKAARLSADIELGADRHKAMLEWGSKNMDPAEYTAMVEEAVANPEAKYSNFVKAVAAKYNARTGDDNPLAGGHTEAMPPMSSDEIRALVKKANKGDRDAVAKLQAANLSREQFASAYTMTR